jgi:hypothetical protein
MAIPQNRLNTLPQVLLDTLCDFLYVHEHVQLARCTRVLWQALIKPCSWRTVVFDAQGYPDRIHTPENFLWSLRRHPARWSQVRSLVGVASPLSVRSMPHLLRLELTAKNHPPPDLSTLFRLRKLYLTGTMYAYGSEGIVGFLSFEQSNHCILGNRIGDVKHIHSSVRI